MKKREGKKREREGGEGRVNPILNLSPTERRLPSARFLLSALLVAARDSTNGRRARGPREDRPSIAKFSRFIVRRRSFRGNLLCVSSATRKRGFRSEHSKQAGWQMLEVLFEEFVVSKNRRKMSRSD